MKSVKHGCKFRQQPTHLRSRAAERPWHHSAIRWNVHKMFHIKIWLKLCADEQLPVLKTDAVCEHDLICLRWKRSRRVQGHFPILKSTAKYKVNILSCLQNRKGGCSQPPAALGTTALGCERRHHFRCWLLSAHISSLLEVILAQNFQDTGFPLLSNLTRMHICLRRKASPLRTQKSKCIKLNLFLNTSYLHRSNCPLVIQYPKSESSLQKQTRLIWVYQHFLCSLEPGTDWW